MNIFNTELFLTGDMFINYMCLRSQLLYDLNSGTEGTIMYTMPPRVNSLSNNCSIF